MGCREPRWSTLIRCLINLFPDTHKSWGKVSYFIRQFYLTEAVKLMEQWVGVFFWFVCFYLQPRKVHAHPRVCQLYRSFYGVFMVGWSLMGWKWPCVSNDPFPRPPTCCSLRSTNTSGSYFSWPLLVPETRYRPWSCKPPSRQTSLLARVSLFPTRCQQNCWWRWWGQLMDRSGYRHRRI